MDTVGKVIAIIIVMVALFIAPLVSMSSTNDAITQSTVYDISSEFVDDVRECGYVSQERYLSFITELDNTGILYNVEMIHSHNTINPVFDEQDVTTESGATVKQQVVVDTNSTTEYYYQDEILDKVYSSDGVYTMTQGDTFSIKVYNRDKTMAQRIRQMVFNYVDGSHPIYVQYGGVIRDEDY